VRRTLATNRRSLSLGVAALVGLFAIAYLVLKLAPDWFAETNGLDAKGRADARQGVRTASLALLAGTIGVVGAVYTARSFALNRAGQLTDRFTKAIEQLGHSALDVRLGGIYALERIARDSEEDHPQVIEVLTAYVREHAPKSDASGQEYEAAAENADALQGTKPKRPPTDVQAVLTVLGRRRLAHEQGAQPVLDLGSTDLSGANLFRANLQGAILSEANLSEANLGEADLQSTIASSANLSGADLHHANLQAAMLTDANVSGANLSTANLQGAFLSGSNFANARLFKADLRTTALYRADLREAVELIEADLRDAGYDHTTTWPDGFVPEASGALEV
jgi:hypothetical protein